MTRQHPDHGGPYLEKRRRSVIKSTGSSSKSKVTLSLMKRFPADQGEDAPQSLPLEPETHVEESTNESPELLEEISSTPAPAPTPELPAVPDTRKQDGQAAIDQELKRYKETKIQEIQGELDRLYEEAKENGYAEGKAQGEQLFAEKSEQLLSQINQLGEQKREDAEGKRDFLMQLATAMTKKIILKEVDTDEQVFMALFGEAFDKITDKDQVVIQVNPEDESRALQYKEEFKEKFKSINHCEIKGNPEISRGGCIIDTKLGYVDATVESKLELLEKAFQKLHESLSKESPEQSVSPIASNHEPTVAAPVEDSSPAYEEASVFDDGDEDDYDDGFDDELEDDYDDGDFDTEDSEDDFDDEEFDFDDFDDDDFS